METTVLVDEKARAAVRDFLDIQEGDPLPSSSVHDLSVLAQWVEQTLRTAVLDRRLAMDTWAEISEALFVSPQAARKRFLAPGHPRREGQVTRYPGRDAYYADRPELAEAWQYRPGEDGRGLAPMGSDESAFRDENEHRWALTISAPPSVLRFDAQWRRVGGLGGDAPCDVVATHVGTGEVAVVGAGVPVGAAVRALHTVHGAKSIQDVAAAIATEVHRPDAVHGLTAVR